MKKRIILAFMLLLAVTLVACGGDRSGPVGEKFVEWYELAEDVDYDGSKVTVEFWHRMGGANSDVVDGWIEEFNEIYPNITVNSTHIADDYDSLSDAIAVAIAAGDHPNIAESYPDHVARYGKSTLALNNFINHPIIGWTEEEQKDFLSGLWNEGTSYDDHGTMLSLPFTKSSEALFYNETYFEKHGYEVPKTWEEVFEIAEDIKKREPDAYPFGYDSSDNFFITMSEQWGAPYTGFDKKTERAEVLFNNDKSKEMIKYFKDKIDKELMITRNLNDNAYTSDIMKTNKKLYMFVGSTGGARYSIEGATNDVFKEGYRVGVAPVPVKDLSVRKQIQQGPNINLFKKDNEQEMIASWLFAKFMLEPEKTAQFALQSGYAPVRHSAYETDEWKDYLDEVVENPKNAKEAGAKVIRDAILMFRDNEDIFFTSTVFNLSSRARGEVGSLTNKIFAYKGDDLNGYIDREYRNSYNYVVN